jgi:copper chaperone CopZ
MMHDTPRAFVGRITLAVAGMTSRRCERVVTDEVRQIAGVTHAIADAVRGTVSVTVDRPIDRSEVAAALVRAGHPPIR